jgi:RNA polymerase sigma factor (sigma-70 family)
MIVRACRATLGTSHDLEDAFQATFLVLVRRADTLWVRDSLGPWLYGVACRVARQSRKLAVRRAHHERRAAREITRFDSPAVECLDDQDDGRLLHEELSGLPLRFRAPLVLCYLEGMTHEQAAEQLGCPIGTVRSRLARGRDRLRQRLLRRGIASAAGWTALESAIPPARAAVSARLTETTAMAACALARGFSRQAVSSTVLRLTEGVCMTMSMMRSKILAAGFMVLAVVGAGVAVVARQDGPASKGEARYDRVSEKGVEVPPQETHFARFRERLLQAPHEIAVPPGATVRIQVEAGDKQVMTCTAFVYEDGLIRITQQSPVPERKSVVTEIGERATGILITPTRPGNLAVTKEELRPAFEKGKVWEESKPAPEKVEVWEKSKRAPEKGEWKEEGEPIYEKGESTRWRREFEPSSDHERRLRELEAKLDRVLRILERQPDGRYRLDPENAVKK